MRYRTLDLLCCLLLLVHWQETASAFVSHQPTSTRRRDSTYISAKTPSWDDLEAMIGSLLQEPLPSSIDSVLNPETPAFSKERPTLFRERHGWCPYSELVWLALELMDVAYDTIRIDNTGGGRPDYFGYGQTPQMKWPKSGRIQGESYDLVQALDADYFGHQLASDNGDVNHVVNQFRNIFPRARPSSRAAYLFQNNGEPLWRGTFEETLAKTNDLLTQTKGSFLCGTSITAADIAWAPFLERYRFQLPCLHEGLQPNDATQYPALAQWYQAMEDDLPAYACRVKGDASSWRKVLVMAGFGNAGAPPQISAVMQDVANQEAEAAASTVKQSVWDVYASSRPYVASTPAQEAALIITRNRQRILKDCEKRLEDLDDLDATLRQLVVVLWHGSTASSLEWDLDQVSNPTAVGKLASFLDERMCVPRDMGTMPAACIKDLAWRIQA